MSTEIICSKKGTVFWECTWGTDNVQGQISKHIFMLNKGYSVYYHSNHFHNTHSFENWGIRKNSLHLVQKYASQDICPRTLSVPRSKQFSESVARGKLWASRNRCLRTNIRAYFCPKWRLLCLLSINSFSNRTQFWKLGNIPRYYPVLAGKKFCHVTHSEQLRARENTW